MSFFLSAAPLFLFTLSGCAYLLGVDNVSYNTEATLAETGAGQHDAPFSMPLFSEPEDSGAPSSADTGTKSDARVADAAADAATADSVPPEAEASIPLSCDCNGTSSCSPWTTDDAGGPDHIDCAIANPAATILRTCSSPAVIKGACKLIEKDIVLNLYWYCC